MLRALLLSAAIVATASSTASAAHHQRSYVTRGVGTLWITPRPRAHIRTHQATRHRRHYARRYSPTHETAHAGNVVATLDAKTHELAEACHARVISGFRPGARVAGTNRISQHAYNHARDLTGDYACIYRHLTAWPGGYSTDPSAVGHIHISLGGPEDGKHFQHGGHSRTHYAWRHYVHRAVWYTPGWHSHHRRHIWA